MAGPILSGCLCRNRGCRCRRRRSGSRSPRRRGWRRRAAPPGRGRRPRRIHRTGQRRRRCRNQVSPVGPAGCFAKTLPHAGHDEGVLHARRQLVKRLTGLTPVDDIQKGEHVQPLTPAFGLHRPESFHIHPADAIERRCIHRIPCHHRLAGLNDVLRPDVGRNRRACALRLDFPPPPPRQGTTSGSTRRRPPERRPRPMPRPSLSSLPFLPGDIAALTLSPRAVADPMAGRRAL